MSKEKKEYIEVTEVETNETPEVNEDVATEETEEKTLGPKVKLALKIIGGVAAVAAIGLVIKKLVTDGSEVDLIEQATTITDTGEKVINF